MATAAIRMSLMTSRSLGASAIRATPCIAHPCGNASRQLSTSSILRTAEQSSKSAAAAPEQQLERMDWNTYFTLRRSRRNYERVFMAPCAILGFLGAGYYFANREFDPTPIMGMDPFFVYGAGTIAGAIVGLATGPVVGNMVFRSVNSKARPIVDKMDKEFYKHIVKNRADPSANSVRNPVPDFYGEKIKSVSEYRSWLRKQREFRRKAQFYVGVD
ncbi:TIM23 complex component [Lunasporangiospora selenospora]|uniref:Presequence translocated-associated motor subunit PAM17 n=1 Tax=Lunasporangiospora selenospora TaxID=979761 RepID=A0A9P6G355_9FUNG|nr:TIM23 complex component [Lunasporangiospora selenospora]